MVLLLATLIASNGKRSNKGMKRWMHFASSCGTSAWPQREGDIWWSLCPTASYGAHPRTPKRITPEALQDWVADTVGWAEVQFTAEAFLAADIHPTQVKPVIQAAFEAAAQLNTPKCRLRQVDLDQLVSRCLAMALAAYPNLKSLVLQELNVYEEAVLTLASGLAESEHLTKLTLDTCDMSSAGWEAVMAALAGSAIRHFKVRGGLSRTAQSAVHACLKHTTTLQVLDLSSNPLGDSAVARLCEALCANKSVKVLKLVNCGFGAEGAAAVAKVVRSSQLLTSLHVSRNQLTSQGCCELGKAIAYSSSLQQLVASYTGWDDQAMQLLAASLPTCPTLHNLDFEYCRITYVGSQALADAALKAPLVQVKLNGNCALGSAGMRTWVWVLVAPGCPLTQLSLSDCEGGDEAAFALAGALHLTSKQGSLEVLEVANNHFTPKGVGELVKAAKGSCTLRTLDVSFNWLGPKAMAACMEAAEQHKETDVDQDDEVGGSSAQPDQWHSPFQGGVAEQGVEPILHAPVEIKYESLLEFREIERIKSGQWQAAPPESAAPDGDQSDEGSPRAPRSAASKAGDDVAAPGPGSCSGSGGSGVRHHPLQSDFALPAGLSQRSAHSSAASTCSSTVSTQTLASSVDGDERDAAELGDDDDLDTHDNPFAEARMPLESRKTGPGVEQQLQSLQDGTINIQLPISFSACDASLPPIARLAPVALAPALKSVTSMPRSLLLGSAQPGGAGSAGHATPKSAAASLRAACLAAASELDEQSDADRSGPNTPTAQKPSTSLLTAQNLSMLNQQLGPAAPAELLMQAAKRHGVVAAVASLPPGPSQPMATAPRQMSMSKLRTSNSASQASQDQSPREGQARALAVSQDAGMDNPFVSNPPTLRLAYSTRPTVAASHKSDDAGHLHDNPFLPPGNPFLKPASSFRQDAVHPSNPFLSLAHSSQQGNKAAEAPALNDNPFCSASSEAEGLRMVAGSEGDPPAEQEEQTLDVNPFR